LKTNYCRGIHICHIWRMAMWCDILSGHKIYKAALQ